MGKELKIVIGEIADISPHPRATKLKLVTVNLGDHSETVVCGAPNLSLSDKVVFAKPGAKLINPQTGEPFTLEPAVIRGVTSPGMLCSERELGISERHEGIMVLSPDAPIGVPLGDYLGDTILDIDITPNRPDCLSTLGVAREIAALFGREVKSPKCDYPESGPRIESHAAVEILAPELCPRYCAGVILGVRVAPSPSWLQERLISYGMRPINNIVDVTNYVMIELGQPLHAFDLNTLEGRRIIVRRAGPDERIVTLDGVERALSPNMLVIADAHRPVALAGVMGGLETEVTEDTEAILLEAANFNFANIRTTAAQLKLRTEASIRFEKGLSPDLALQGLKRALTLIRELAGGEVCTGIIDVYPGRKEARPIPFKISEVKRLLGIEIPPEEVGQILRSLGFSCRESSPGVFDVLPPYWRTDVKLPADLVEEVARIYGYERIPTTGLRGEVPQSYPEPLMKLKDRVREVLVGLGLQEVVTYSLVSEDRLRQTSSPLGLRVVNPLSREQEYLRTSLRCGLLSTVSLNRKHEEGIAVFELGRVYLPKEGGLPEEREVLGCALYGVREELSWLSRREEVDFYEIKGVIEALLSRLNLTADFRTSREPCFIPGRQAAIYVEAQPIGLIGEVHPRVRQFFEIPRPVFLAELDLGALLPYALKLSPYEPLPRFPAVIRDIAVIVDRDIPAQRLLNIIRGFPLVTGVVLFDLYTGSPVPPEKKSLAFRLTFRSPERTLTDEEVASLQDQIIERLGRELGAELRH